MSFNKEQLKHYFSENPKFGAEDNKKGGQNLALPWSSLPKA